MQNQDGKRIGLWITGVHADFSMGGGFAQSRIKRQWFPRNFTQPVFAIEGIAPNQYEYGRLAEFVRNAQLQAVQRGGNDVLTFLRINGGGMPNVRNQRGKHGGFLLGGFIQSMERRAEVGVNVPTWQISFTVATSNNSPLFNATRTRGRILRAWTGIINPKTVLGGGTQFVNQQTKATNQNDPSKDYTPPASHPDFNPDPTKWTQPFDPQSWTP